MMKNAMMMMMVMSLLWATLDADLDEKKKVFIYI